MTRPFQRVAIFVSFVFQTIYTYVLMFLQIKMSFICTLFSVECSMFVLSTICAFSKRFNLFRIPTAIEAWGFAALSLMSMGAASLLNISFIWVDLSILLASLVMSAVVFIPANKMKKHFYVERLMIKDGKLSPAASKAIGGAAVSVIAAGLIIILLRSMFPNQIQNAKVRAVLLLIIAAIWIIAMQFFAISFLLATIDYRKTHVIQTEQNRS